VLATRTFLFSDLRDYTRFVETHGDEAARTLIADYRRIVRAEIAKHEGAEVKTEGDSFYVVFTNARAAVACASAILREADRYSRERPERPMRIGAGIHAGEPVPHEGQYVGSAVIVAARLAQQSEAGELLVSEVVRALLPKNGAPRMTERDGLVLKGINDPPRIYRVDWRAVDAPPAKAAEILIEAATPVSRQVLSPIIVGRDRESAALAGFLADATAGRGRAVLVSGDAGLGKSALLRKFREDAAARGARVLIGECSEIEARRPFGPFIDALAAAKVPLPAELGQGGPGAQPIAELERYRVHAAFADRLTELAREAPLVLVIEDLHWADEATYELVPYLARKLRTERVMLIATYRSDELHRLHPLNHVLAELSRGRLAEDVRLKKLSLEETGDVVRAALGLSQPPTAEFRQALFERTEGNPFFLEEILRALVEKGELEFRDGSWRRTKKVAELAIPVSVRDAVQQRLLTIDERSRKALQVAAVIGQRFDFELLLEVSMLDEAALLDAIKAGIDAQLLTEEGADGAEVFAFRHALSRESVLTDMLQRERRLLHRSVGEAVERRAGGALAAKAEDLAYHFDQARDPRAFTYHELAATGATRASAFSRAAYHLERAIELASDDEPRIGELQLRLADQAFSADELNRSLRAGEQALATFESSGDMKGAGEAIQRIAGVRWMFGETERARTMIVDAIARLEPLGDSIGLARCYGEAARLAMLGERMDEARSFGEKAIEIAKRIGALDVEIFTYNTVGTATAQAADDRGFELLRKSLALSLEHGMVPGAQRAYNNLIATTMRYGQYEDARRLQAESAVHAARHGVRPEVFVQRDLLFKFDGDGDDWDAAIALHRSMVPDTIWWHGRFVGLALTLVARDGPNEDVFTQLERSRERLLAAGDPQWVAEAGLGAAALLVAGRYDEALVAAESGREGITIGHYGLLARISAPLLSAALAHADSDTVDRWSHAVLDREDAVWAQPAARAFARGILARRAGDADGAIGHYEEAATLAEAQRGLWRWTMTYALLGLAEIHAAARRTHDAGEAFDRAVAKWRWARATWYVAELERWAAKRGIPVAGA
jgi:class 3 adenylate cyclase/tetratricopeptide (TPR) repeat protein